MKDQTVVGIFYEKLSGCKCVGPRHCTDHEDIEDISLEDISCMVAEQEPCLLNECGRGALNSLRDNLHVEVLQAWLHNQDLKPPPLELLCFLHKSGLVQISTFLYFKPEFCDIMSAQLVDIITKDFCSARDQEEASDIVKVLLSWMINVGNQTLRELYSLSSALMESFTAKLMKVLFSDDRGLRMDFLSMLSAESESVVFEEGMKCFAGFIMSSLLLNRTSDLCIKKSLKIHHKCWTCEDIPSKFKSLYSQLEGLLGKDTVMREVELAVYQGNFNLKHLLYTVALMSSHTDLVKSRADKWFKEALSERNETLLSAALVIIRHHFAQVSKYLVGYANWFGSIQLKTAFTIDFLFEFLTKLVPHEPAVFLKIQVTKVPSGPPCSQGVISDYVSLARTCLADMNQTYDYISLFNDFHETLEEQQESDVERVVKHFRESGEVAKAVLEANVFRKQYYDKVFLPCLLSSVRGSDEARDGLIIKLNTMGKIPSPLYRAWSRTSSSR